MTSSTSKHIAGQTLPPVSLKPGLYIVATPIGNLGDITLRALSTLHAVDLIACEDTRVTLKLLRHFGIDAKLDAYHEHNAIKKRPELLAKIAGGATVALVSDAGTPLISDPGYKLVREAVAAGLHVETLPGPSSAMAALCVAGLPTDRFLFLGFLPAKPTAARTCLHEIAPVRTTLVCFESTQRLGETLALMHEELGNRDAAVARELTKLYEEVKRGTLTELATYYHAQEEVRGEAVIVVGPPQPVIASGEQLDALLKQLLATMSLKDAVTETCRTLNLPHSQVYKRALELKE